MAASGDAVRDPAHYGSPAGHDGPATAWSSYDAAAPAASRDAGRKASPLVVIVILIALLLATAAAVFALNGGEEPVPLIPGWQLLEGGGVSIQLPASYSGGNPAADPDAVAASVRAMGGDYRALAEWVRMNEDTVILVAADSLSSTPGFVSNMNVVAEEVPSSMTMEEYLAAGAQQVPQMFEVQDSAVVSLGTETVGRVVTRFQAPDGQMGMQVAYAFKDGDTAHVVTYTTSVQEWATRLPLFEQSVATFRH